ncbi:squalene--hopene cyclase [Parageobacillus sp. VR-IP]|uniref:squalene--hopene cyclase n=1 Tax=Parageobacillus sp. VR-IP TaxID=2742205 RepID=UPI001582247B|nr:squalene--hopene cyclase [Parageobacillus sp. VR-IP]NUK30138.1 squalene--hopene cyclase [Parageobacillus sp. VR-IP]
MASVTYSISGELSRLVATVKREQAPDGSWRYPFETGISTDAYMIILLRTLEINDEDLIRKLVERIESRQEGNGAWKLFYDEGEGNVTATVEAYYALLYSGYRKKTDPHMQAAKQRILEMGGIEKVHMFAKFMLAMTGQYRWPRFFPIPVEFLLLPSSFPLHFFDISVYGRANLTPLLILTDNKYYRKTRKSPDLSDLFLSRADHGEKWGLRADRLFLSYLKQSLIGLPGQIHAVAKQRAVQYMLQRLEADGTFYSYFSSTFLMIFALLSLGYPKDHPIIVKAINGLKTFRCSINGYTHMQYTTATVWNTALASYALQEAGVPPSDAAIEKANRYLLSRQHYRYGDWAVHNPYSLPGGWGFSNINTINPDVDDTTASLRAIYRQASKKTLFRHAWDRGLHWLLSMQNDDGGYGAFEKNVNKRLFHYVPIQGAEFLLTDPSTADLTGRTLEFLGTFANLTKDHPAIARGVEWLIDHQEKNGSWYGRWGICYIYGTWAAVTGMIAAGVPPTHHAIQKAAKWLLSIQNSDGGWGESCKSDSTKTYVPLRASTATHTAWALDALIAVFDQPIPAIQTGIQFLLQSIKKEDWTASYPTGQGMAGGFYIRYHSYRRVFPLLTLSHYEKKFGSLPT